MSLFEDLQQRRAKVLFLGFGNSGRSQIAEALARATAADVLEAHSAGLAPGSFVSRRAATVLAERNVTLAPDQKPKNIATLDLNSFDVVVNLCEYPIPSEVQIPKGVFVLSVPIPDPMGKGEQAYNATLAPIENMVQFLGEHFRRAREWRAPEGNEMDWNAATPAPTALAATQIAPDLPRVGPPPLPAATLAAV